MAIKGFEYKEFAKNLSEQAYGLIPPDFDENKRNYVANTLLNFATVAGQALNDDKENKFNSDQAMMITQIIAEWSFHKSVDLIRSGIPQMYWDNVMQKIAFTIFEIAKKAFAQAMPQDQILELIEHHVKKVYVEAIEELKSKNLINDDLLEQATNQSNIDAMIQEQAANEQAQAEAQEANDNQVAKSGKPANRPTRPAGHKKGKPKAPIDTGLTGANKKTLRLSTLALLFQKMKQEKVQTILDKFNPDDATTVIKYMGIKDLPSKVDPHYTLQCLQEIKMTLPKPVQDISPSKIVNKLQNIAECVDKKKLEQLLNQERVMVKRFVFSALEGEYIEMPPKIANIIATHLENSV
ncbi:MAG: hypothetical protein R3Y28_00545 [Candidatus Gastranaerophilales bacterium]